MRSLRRRILLVVAVLAVAILACDFSFNTANIPEAYMSLDADGQQPSTVYRQDATFYAIVTLSNAPDGTTVEARWYAVAVEGAAPETFLEQASITSGSAVLTFHIANDLLWPPGEYRVDIYLNEELETSLDFAVE